MSYILSCESTVDLPYEYVSSRNIPVLFYHYSVDDKLIEDVMERDEEQLKQFYDYIDAGKIPSTSQLNAAEYEDFFDALLQKDDVIHLCFGTGMTNSYANACMAAEELREKYPDRKLIVIDTLCSCGGYGLMTDLAADKRDEGLSIEELEKWVNENKGKIQHHFTNTDLTYFKRTGRLSGPAATIATVLDICPLMHLDAAGKMIAYSKIRGKKKMLRQMAATMMELADGGADYDGPCYINDARNREDAETIKEYILELMPNAKIRMGRIGTIIASHCGPGTISFYFVGKERE